MPNNKKGNNFLSMLALSRIIGKTQGNNNLSNLLSRRRKVPAETPFYNQALRRFFYSDNGGFYIIIGLNKNGSPIKRRVPGRFVYVYNKKLGRIVPFRTGGSTPRRRRV
jgi:hypothetical protein